MDIARFKEPHTATGPTLNMVLDALKHENYDVQFSPEIPFRALKRVSIIGPNEDVPINSFETDSVIYLINYEDLKKIAKPTAGAIIVYCTNDALVDFGDDEKINNFDNAAIVSDTSSKRRTFQSFCETVINFMLAANEYIHSLDITSRSSVSFQDLVDIAQDWFAEFMHITDANNILLAYTKDIVPPDEINATLIALGHHSEEWLRMKSQINVPAKFYGRRALSVFPAHKPFNTNLVTAALTIRGRYYAHIVFTCKEENITSGLLDSLEIFVTYCQKLAEKRCRTLSSRDFESSGFLTMLLTEPHLNSVFINEQAQKINVPTHGSFTLACIYTPTLASQAELSNLSDIISSQLTHKHKTIIFEDSIGILFYGNDWYEMMDANVQVANSGLINPPFEMYSSDIYEELSDTYYAYKQINAIKKYGGLVRKARVLTDSKRFSHIITFHDVFCFFWDNPFSDKDLKEYSLKHTRLAKMEIDDKRDGTNNVELLNAYLMHERKATPVSEKFHMHRNGVIYRIGRIEEIYQISLDEHMTRQYLQMCTRISMCMQAESEIIEGFAGQQDNKNVG